jgi:hypothetical protein
LSLLTGLFDAVPVVYWAPGFGFVPETLLLVELAYGQWNLATVTEPDPTNNLHLHERPIVTAAWQLNRKDLVGTSRLCESEHVGYRFMSRALGPM